MNRLGFLLLMLFAIRASGTDFPSQDSVRKGVWLPAGQLFPSLLYDLNEARTGGSLYGFNMNGEWQNRAFANFSAGMRKNIYRWDASRASEAGFELSVNTQFLFEQPFEFFQVNLFSVDFKVGVFYQMILSSSLKFRSRLYHVSSHLGDDFIYRFFIDTFLENKRIYEVIDASLAYERKNFTYYGLVGFIPHTAYERKPLILQAGAQWQHKAKNKSWLAITAGADLKMEQETNFYPGIHMGCGVRLGNQDQMPFTVMFDYYQGPLPHSLFDKTIVGWIGASLLFHPF